VLDMGDPVKIVDLAKRMIELSGLSLRDDANPDGDIEITIVGLRPGEKLYEELLIGNNPETTGHARILKARENHLSSAALLTQFESLRSSINAEDAKSIRDILIAMVPDYASSNDVSDWLFQQAANGR
jgi:FlaA1/EpsC-like NDP-sugar epimerase